MPHKGTYRKLKSGVQEVKEGFPLARQAMKSFANRPRKLPLEERDKQDIRDIQGKFKRRQQIEALKRKMK